MKLRIFNENNNNYHYYINKRNNINNIDLELLDEGIGAIFKPVIGFFKGMLSIAKKVGGAILRGTGLAKIGETILNMLGSLTIVKRFTDVKSKEKEAKDIIKSISIGDAFADINRLINKLSFTLWKGITLDFPPFNKDGQSVERKNEFWKGVFAYNKRTTWLQNWYSQLIKSGINPSYAKAYMVIVSFRIPIYNIWYNFKPFWWKGTSNKTLDDEGHSFTAGDTINDENGLNEAEKKIQNKFRELLRIQNNDNYTELQKNSKIGRKIAFDSLIGFLIPFIFLSFNFFKMAFNVGDNFFTHHANAIIKFIVCGYYFYFLITGLMISSVAIEQEEKFNPSEDKAGNEGGLELNK